MTGSTGYHSRHGRRMVLSPRQTSRAWVDVEAYLWYFSVPVSNVMEETMEHEHVITSELTAISTRLHALDKHLEGDHEMQHWLRACEEIDTLLVLVKQRIETRGVY